MKKSDLRTGMFIVFNNGNKFKVILNALINGMDDDFIVSENDEDGMSYKLNSSYLPDCLDKWTMRGGVTEVIVPIYKKYFNRRYIDLDQKEIVWEKKKTHTIELDGVKKTISDESYNNLKELFSGEQK